MLEWLLILYIDDSREYIGTFESCAHATQYFQECVKGDHKSWSTACLTSETMFNYPKTLFRSIPRKCK
jgi:hypothetical protein